MMSRDLRHILIASLGASFLACSSSPVPRFSSVVVAATSCGESVEGALREITFSHGSIYDHRRVTLNASGRVAIHHRHMANGPGPMFNVGEHRCLATATVRPLLAGLVELLNGPAKKDNSTDSAPTLCLENWTWPDGRKESPPSPGRCFDIAAAVPVQAALPSFDRNLDVPCLDGAKVCGLKIESGAAPHPHERYAILFDATFVAADGAWWCLRPLKESSEYELVRGRLPPAEAATLLSWLLDGVASSASSGEPSRFEIGANFQTVRVQRPDGATTLDGKQTAIVRQRFAHLAPQLSPACILR